MNKYISPQLQKYQLYYNITLVLLISGVFLTLLGIVNSLLDGDFIEIFLPFFIGGFSLLFSFVVYFELIFSPFDLEFTNSELVIRYEGRARSLVRFPVPKDIIERRVPWANFESIKWFKKTAYSQSQSTRTHGNVRETTTTYRPMFDYIVMKFKYYENDLLKSVSLNLSKLVKSFSTQKNILNAIINKTYQDVPVIDGVADSKKRNLIIMWIVIIGAMVMAIIGIASG